MSIWIGTSISMSSQIVKESLRAARPYMSGLALRRDIHASWFTTPRAGAHCHKYVNIDRETRLCEMRSVLSRLTTDFDQRQQLQHQWTISNSFPSRHQLKSSLCDANVMTFWSVCIFHCFLCLFRSKYSRERTELLQIEMLCNATNAKSANWESVKIS